MKNGYFFFGKITLLLLWAAAAAGQGSFRFKVGGSSLPAVQRQGRLLPNAWTGGLNAPQCSKMHLNADTVEDLVVFDRSVGRVSTYLAVKAADGSFFWQYDPTGESLFPAISNWMLLADYDGDGRKDLFTSTPAGIRVFRNTPAPGGRAVAWQVVADPLYTEGFSGKVNLLVTSADIPAITDVDNDGDTDILVFDPSGNFVEFHRNQSLETSGIRGLNFRRTGYCWGNFLKEHCRDFCFSIDCETGTANCPGLAPPPGGRPLHAGNSLLLADVNADGLKDALFGHITCTNLAFLPNAGSAARAVFRQAIYEYPTVTPVSMSGFPAAYAEDVTFDGTPDLLVAPNVAVSGHQVDFSASLWLYPSLSQNPALLKKNFLQEDMIDLGENATPLLADVDADGDADLLVGSEGRQTPQGFLAGLTLYRNTGTAEKAVFTWETDDYLGIAASVQARQGLLLTGLRPFVGDLNADGRPDLCYLAQTFKGPTLRFLPNRGHWLFDPATEVEVPVPDGMRPTDQVQVLDLNADGRADLLAGSLYGGLSIYRNNGTASAPAFVRSQTNWAGTAEQIQNQGFSFLVHDLNADRHPDLLLAYADGTLRAYDNVLARTDFSTPPDSGLLPPGIRLGESPYLAAADLDADGLPDLLAGTRGGGVQLLHNQSEKRAAPVSGLLVYPNPARSQVRVEAAAGGLLLLLTATGQTVWAGMHTGGGISTLSVQGLTPGVYVLRLEAPGGPQARRLVLY